jgi:hypothetical protein
MNTTGHTGHPTDDPNTDPATSLDPRNQALMAAIVAAMARIAVQSKRLWYDSAGGIRLESKKHCPTLHQFMTMVHQTGMTDEETEDMISRHMHATLAAEIATYGHRNARTTLPGLNFDVSTISGSIAYESAVAYKVDLPPHNDVYAQTHPAHVYYAGDIRTSLFTVTKDSAEEWLQQLGAAHAFCISVEVGQPELALTVDSMLIEELAIRLANRAVGDRTHPEAEPPRGRREEPLSPRDLEELIQRFVPLSSDLVATTLSENQTTLQMLIRLCEAKSHEQITQMPVHEVDFYAYLFKATRIGSAPHELRVELHHSGGEAASGADRDVLDALALALGGPTPPLRARSLWNWVCRHGARTRLAAIAAFQTISNWTPPSSGLFVHTVRADDHHLTLPRSKKSSSPSSSAPPACVRVGANNIPLVRLPVPSHVSFHGNYRLAAPRLHLPYGRLGLVPKQVLSLCLLCSLWELLHAHAEAPMRMLSPRLAAFACELAADEALAVSDMLLYQMNRKGTFVSNALASIRREIGEHESEFSDAAAQASCAMRHFSLAEFETLFDGRTPEGVRRLSAELTRRLQTLLGESPMRDDVLPPSLLAACGLIADTDHVSVITSAHTTEEHRSMLRHSGPEGEAACYYPRFALELLLSYTIPAVVGARNYICPGVGVGDVDALLPFPTPSALATCLSTNARAREWLRSAFASKEEEERVVAPQPPHDSVLRLSPEEMRALPPECAQFLCAQANRAIGLSTADKRQAFVAWRRPRASSTSSGAKRPTQLCIDGSALRALETLALDTSGEMDVDSSGVVAQPNTGPS